jgi:nucleoside-diphosphate-sugar epimerase
MRIFITGGSGFIGGHIIENLSPQHHVLALARSPASASKVERYGAQPILGDLSDLSASHMHGCDAVIHCAAFVEQWGSRSQFWTANVEGTQRALTAAQHAHVPRFIHIGTEAAVFHGDHLRDIDETYPYPLHHRFPYSESKAEAERLVLSSNSPSFTTLSLRPRLVWGPRDTSVFPAILDMLHRKQWRWIDHGQHLTSVVHVLNLVHASRLALTLGQGGLSYFIADSERHITKDFISSVVLAYGLSLPSSSIPGWLARAAAQTTESLWRLLRRTDQPPLTLFAASMMSREITVRTDRAAQHLGYSPPLSFQQGLATISAERSTP